MRNKKFEIVIGVLLVFAADKAHAECVAHIRSAVADPGRIEANSVRDEGRQPCEILSYFRPAEGSVHFELLGTQGFYTELFSSLVGPDGTVYHHNNAIVLQLTPPDQIAPLRERIESGDLGNVEWLEAELEEIPLEDASVDSISAVLSLHDYYWMSTQPESGAFPELFRILRPGGRLLVVDHSAVEGSRTSAAVDQNGLHRIDQAYLRAVLEQVGFVLETETDLLRNPDDDRTLPFFDRSLWRDKTDRFVMTFSKPE